MGDTLITAVFNLVGTVDNDGEPCEVCQTEGCEVSATVYGVAVTGAFEHAHMATWTDCCLPCVPAVVATLDPTADIVVDVSLSAFLPADDRMATPDDTRPHLDAL